MTFIQDNLLLFLGIAATLLTLVGSIIGAIANKRKASYALMVAVAVCATVTAQQVISFQEARQQQALAESRTQQQELLQESRGLLMTSIQETVLETRDVVENIADKLGDTPLAGVATAMVLVDDNPARLESSLIKAYGKESARAWINYADWVEESSANSEDELRCLYLTLNAGRNYVTGLILAYLYTGEPTREVIEGMLERQAWNAFPDAAFIERFGLQTPGVQCLLVFDGDREHLVAFADSSRFAQELITYQQNGMSKTVETALNKNPQVDALMKLFPSLSDNVLSGSATRALVEEMIRNQIAEAVALDGRAPYLLELQNIISLAAKPD